LPLHRWMSFPRVVFFLPLPVANSLKASPPGACHYLTYLDCVVFLVPLDSRLTLFEDCIVEGYLHKCSIEESGSQSSGCVRDIQKTNYWACD
jgi:hypothetical protein